MGAGALWGYRTPSLRSNSESHPHAVRLGIARSSIVYLFFLKKSVRPCKRRRSPKVLDTLALRVGKPGSGLRSRTLPQPCKTGSIPQHWCNGNTSVFQTEDASSTLVCCSMRVLRSSRESYSTKKRRNDTRFPALACP